MATPIDWQGLINYYKTPLTLLNNLSSKTKSVFLNAFQSKLGSGNPDDDLVEGWKAFLEILNSKVIPATAKEETTNQIATDIKVSPNVVSVGLAGAVPKTTVSTAKPTLESIEAELKKAQVQASTIQQGIRELGTTEAETIGGYKVLYNAQGNRVEVSSEDEAEATARGYVYASPPQISAVSTATTPDFTGLIKTLTQYIVDLEKRGQIINPEKEITKEDLARFMSQAEREIDPYYAGQLRLAKESLLRDLQYTSDQIIRFEQEQQKQYGRQLRELSESMAEKGMTAGTRRLTGERELAEDVGTKLTGIRAQAKYAGETGLRSFAELWGGTEIPYLQNMATIGGQPRVLPGISQFQLGTSNEPFYTLRDSVLADLKGTRTYEQEAEKRRRVSELESGARTLEEINLARQLT